MQFKPSIDLAVPLWGGLITPAAGYSHYLYNRDLDAVAGYVNRLYEAGRGDSRLSSLSSTLYADSWHGSLAFGLPWGLGFRGSYLSQRLLGEDGWNNSVDVSVSSLIADDYFLQLGSSRNVSAGIADPSIELTLRVDFED